MVTVSTSVNVIVTNLVYVLVTVESPEVITDVTRDVVTDVAGSLTGAVTVTVLTSVEVNVKVLVTVCVTVEPLEVTMEVTTVVVVNTEVTSSVTVIVESAGGLVTAGVVKFALVVGEPVPSIVDLVALAEVEVRLRLIGSPVAVRVIIDDVELVVFDAFPAIGANVPDGANIEVDVPLAERVRLIGSPVAVRVIIDDVELLVLDAFPADGGNIRPMVVGAVPLDERVRLIGSPVAVRVIIIDVELLMLDAFPADGANTRPVLVGANMGVEVALAVALAVPLRPIGSPSITLVVRGAVALLLLDAFPEDGAKMMALVVGANMEEFEVLLEVMLGDSVNMNVVGAGVVLGSVTLPLFDAVKEARAEVVWFVALAMGSTDVRFVLGAAGAAVADTKLEVRPVPLTDDAVDVAFVANTGVDSVAFELWGAPADTEVVKLALIDSAAEAALELTPVPREAEVVLFTLFEAETGELLEPVAVTLDDVVAGAATTGATLEEIEICELLEEGAGRDAIELRELMAVPRDARDVVGAVVLVVFV
ncbi:hypothetical protein B0A50_08657 [Salinomyces thailandicus]|uniref:Uncharacterized protein n=1 Tax=Salinomyces thailandicus TaxID=706561 RepID=A0A4U0TJG3_9PEZI|nr:hypothetical protein B0A50_08657 [Salinomyces thailandica]